MIGKKRERPIGIFDSGIGGLTVVKEIIRTLPDEEIIYFGDTARLPYGNKSAQTVIRFSLENTRFLLKFGIKFLIVACNTSSSLALPALRKNFNIPVLGVIKPAVKKAVGLSPKGRIGIIGTRATINSRCYPRQIKKISPGSKSFTQACPLFVSLVEEGWLQDKLTLEVARRYLAPLQKKKIDTLILGCTHYLLLKQQIKQAMGRKINFVDSAKETALEARGILEKSGLCARPRRRRARCKFYVSDAPDRFRSIGRRFLGQSVKFVKMV